MTGRPDGRRQAAPASASRDKRLEDLAACLDFEPPPFAGPLVVFDPSPERACGDPVYLGGDLHAVHPDAGHRPEAEGRDRNLDNARVTFGEVGPSWPEALAVEGIWCVRLEGECVRLSPFLMLWDDLGRLRAWLLLPPAEAMLGEGHLWLPSVPPPRSPFPGAPGNPSSTS